MTSGAGDRDRHNVQDRRVDVKAPTLGIPIHPEGILGVVAELHCSAGSHVLEDETMAVVDTDKMAVDVKAPHSGVVRAVTVAADEEVKSGQVMFVIERFAQGATVGGEERQWAWELQKRKMLEAQEAERHFQEWQRKWRHEQKRRWQDWQQRQERGWWRQQQAWWRTQGRRQGQQQGRAETPRSRHPRLSSKAKGLPPGDARSMLLATNHYEALRVAKTCTQADVKKAFRQLAIRLHPDTAASSSAMGGEERKAILHEAFARLQDAHSTLANPQRRREYDRELGW